MYVSVVLPFIQTIVIIVIIITMTTNSISTTPPIAEEITTGNIIEDVLVDDGSPA